jgi:hypothetical protein
MNGTTTSKVTITLRNPIRKYKTIEYTITPADNLLAKDWVIALKKLLQDDKLLEKNFCFMGFPDSARTLDYLCDELNSFVKQINLFNITDKWQQAGLKPYIIEEYFTPDTVRFGNEYPIGYGQNEKKLGLNIKHRMMNKLHNHFERLQGTVWELSDYYKIADYDTKYAIRQLNNLCHEIESLVLSQRKQETIPEWVRPSQITTFLHADRYELTDEHRAGFVQNKYNRKFGNVYMHWTQIGKTLFEVFRDEDAPDLDSTQCEVINSLKYYSGEFDVEWGNDVVYGQNLAWHDDEQNAFTEWLIKNNLDPEDATLSLGYLHIGTIDLQSSFGTTDPIEIRSLLSDYLDICSIEIDDIINTYDYCWTDEDHQQKQIDQMRPGYDYSSSRG